MCLKNIHICLLAVAIVAITAALPTSSAADQPSVAGDALPQTESTTHAHPLELDEAFGEPPTVRLVWAAIASVIGAIILMVGEDIYHFVKETIFGPKQWKRAGQYVDKFASLVIPPRPHQPMPLSDKDDGYNLALEGYTRGGKHAWGTVWCSGCEEPVGEWRWGPHPKNPNLLELILTLENGVQKKFKFKRTT